MTAIRSFFHAQGFIEAEPSILQVSPGNEAHLCAFATELIGPAGGRKPLYLHASPEFACKKLLAAGERKIFSLTRVFRNRDAGPLHQPEFTMLEWYRAEESLDSLARDCASVVRVAAEAAGTQRLLWRGASADAFAEPDTISVAEAFRQFADVDLLSTMGRGGEGDAAALAAQARGVGLRVADDDRWSDLFSKILSERVEPKLGLERPLILCGYPASEAALARRNPCDERLAERFELYCCGVELANAFGELTDSSEQRRRFVAEMDERERVYGERYPIDEDFLAALEIMPEASGCALGVDRLVMLCAGAERIEQVVWTPIAPMGPEWA